MKTKGKKQPPARAEEREQRVRLTYTQPPSNKEYQANLLREGNGWVVNFAYGRIGATLKTGTKTTTPVDYATALKVYTKLVAEKIAEGYVADASASTESTYQAPVAKEDTGLRPQLLEPLTLDLVDPFITDDHWCMQPKFDGNRVFIIANAAGVTGANRKGQKISLPVNVVAWAQSKLSDRRASFKLDGELVGNQYFAFDILEANGTPLTELAYSLRLSILAQFRDASPDAAVAETARSAMDKLTLLARLQNEHAEGAVFKSLAARYTPGRQPTQVKCKSLAGFIFWVVPGSILNSCKTGG